MPLQRVTDPADPRRCKAPTAEGQCMNLAEDGSDYCLAHARPTLGPSPSKRIYMLAKADARKRLAELADHEEVKSLREEIAMTRMMIETLYNSIKDDQDMMAKWPAIERATHTVHKLVKDCHVIEQNLGNLLAKQTILSLAHRVCQIVVDRLEGIENYEEITDDIIRQIVAAVKDAGNDGVVRTVALLPSS
jgi:hypothetical protein